MNEYNYYIKKKKKKEKEIEEIKNKFLKEKSKEWNNSKLIFKNKDEEIEKLKMMIEILIEMYDSNEIDEEIIDEEDIFKIRMLIFNIEEIKIFELKHLLCYFESAIDEFFEDIEKFDNEGVLFIGKKEKHNKSFFISSEKEAEEIDEIIYDFHEEIDEQRFDFYMKEISEKVKKIERGEIKCVKNV